MGGDLQYTTCDIFNQGSPGGDPKPFNFYDPVYGKWTPSDLATANDVVSKVRQLGIYTQDQFKVDKFAFTLGGRVDWARVNQDSEGGTGAYATARNAVGTHQRNDRKVT